MGYIGNRVSFLYLKDKGFNLKYSAHIIFLVLHVHVPYL